MVNFESAEKFVNPSFRSTKERINILSAFSFCPTLLRFQVKQQKLKTRNEKSSKNLFLPA